jgi:hypothetical protein
MYADVRSEKPQMRMAGRAMAHIRIYAGFCRYERQAAASMAQKTLPHKTLPRKTLQLYYRRRYHRRRYQGLRIMPFFPILMCGP